MVPWYEPAIRLIDSSMSVPPRSFTPQRSASTAASRPIFTHDACTPRAPPPGVVPPQAAPPARGLEPHLPPRPLPVPDRPPGREPNHRRVLQVLLARDLLDPVRAAEHRVERDERQRHELRDPAR